ncbi:MAG: hypothetical protein OXG68_11550 [Chloroflexi bacterium]|nr:hypothetical protein [Chloroflexota bacterium]
MRKKWGDEACIEALDAILAGKWTFTLWHGSRCFGIHHTPADVAAAEIKPVTHLRTSVEFYLPWVTNPISMGQMMNARRWLTEHRQLKAIGEKHENPVYHAWYCSLFDKEAAHVG